ncbi:MAG: DNA repair protein RecO [Gemmatales bacterium]|nr:MAG: DNA repair protein RecO [Gemmatales bacterium]
MAAEKALALVVRTVDWSETSRIATLWTRELGKVRVLAKGGRRLKSNFESALDLLTVCRIVLLRKSSGGLDLLTEAQVAQRFPQLRRDLPALYAGYYIAELLADSTEDYDPHPALFDEAVAALTALGTTGVSTPLRLARFELVWLRELGYQPELRQCVVCAAEVEEKDGLVFRADAGGIVCTTCQKKTRRGQDDFLSPKGLAALRELSENPEAWRRDLEDKVRVELRQVLNRYVTYLRGKPAKLLPYLRS